jgi:hypothetical protein
MSLPMINLLMVSVDHNTGCKFIGKLKDKSNCDSPLRRSAGSVDSLIGQVRAIFRDYGRGSEWNDTLGLGNPAAKSNPLSLQ